MSASAASTSGTRSIAVTIARALLWRARYATSLARNDAVHGMTIAPCLSPPTTATCHAGTRGSITRSGAPGGTPSPASAFMKRLLACFKSQNVQRSR